MSPPPSGISTTLTRSGCSTRPRATYSTSSFTPLRLFLRGRAVQRRYARAGLAFGALHRLRAFTLPSGAAARGALGGRRILGGRTSRRPLGCLGRRFGAGYACAWRWGGGLGRRRGAAGAGSRWRGLGLGDTFGSRGCGGGHGAIARDALALEQPRHAVARLGPIRQPTLSLGRVDHYGRRLGARVVVPQDVQKRAVAGGAGVGHDHPIGRLLLSARAAQANSQHTCFLTVGTTGSDAWRGPARTTIPCYLQRRIRHYTARARATATWRPRRDARHSRGTYLANSGQHSCSAARGPPRAGQPPKRSGRQSRSRRC